MSDIRLYCTFCEQCCSTPLPPDVVVRGGGLCPECLDLWSDEAFDELVQKAREMRSVRGPPPMPAKTPAGECVCPGCVMAWKEAIAHVHASHQEADWSMPCRQCGAPSYVVRRSDSMPLNLRSSEGGDDA